MKTRASREIFLLIVESHQPDLEAENFPLARKPGIGVGHGSLTSEGRQATVQHR